MTDEQNPVLEAEPLDWMVGCDRETFDKCRTDEKFPFIVTLARAVNALNFVHSAMLHAGETDSPDAQRERMNSYYFASAILYEGIKLIRTMKNTFKDDPIFQQGLLLLLRDPVAQQIERDHLNPARNGVVFHFLPERFAATIDSATVNECVFIQARGTSKKHVYYTFADVVAAEILVGFASDTEEFYQALGAAMATTRKLVIRFADYADILIGRHTQNWGFKLTERIR
jgi:hypothetical protein